MIKYTYEGWDIKEGTEHKGFDGRVYIDSSDNPVTGILEGFYGYTGNTGDEINCQYVENGKRSYKSV